MSNPDSFIEEVTEEVRRDRLFAAFRKYGWIGGLVVLGIVGGAAWNEWQKSQAAARAQGFGDAMLEALDTGGAVERREAMAAAAFDRVISHRLSNDEVVNDIISHPALRTGSLNPARQGLSRPAVV